MSTPHEKIQLQANVPEQLFGKRLDQALAEMFPDYSRSRIKEWILADYVKVNGQILNRPREKLIGEELIEINAQSDHVIAPLPNGNWSFKCRLFVFFLFRQKRHGFWVE